MGIHRCSKRKPSNKTQFDSENLQENIAHGYFLIEGKCYQDKHLTRLQEGDETSSIPVIINYSSSMSIAKAKEVKANHMLVGIPRQWNPGSSPSLAKGHESCQPEQRD